MPRQVAVPRKCAHSGRPTMQWVTMQVSALQRGARRITYTVVQVLPRPARSASRAARPGHHRAEGAPRLLPPPRSARHAGGSCRAGRLRCGTASSAGPRPTLRTGGAGGAVMSTMDSIGP